MASKMVGISIHETEIHGRDVEVEFIHRSKQVGREREALILNHGFQVLKHLRRK